MGVCVYVHVCVCVFVSLHLYGSMCECVSVVCVCFLPLCFSSLRKKGGRDLNTKACVKSRNVTRSGAFGGLLRRQRSKRVQLICLY